MGTTLLKPEHATNPEPLVQVQPAIDGIGVAWLQEAVAGDGVGRLPISDFQQGGAAFADIGPRVVVAMVGQFVALSIGQG
jgi:hypothetical protein